MFCKAVIAAVLLAGCSDLCGRTSDCATGYVCAASGACVLPPSDGGAGDDAAPATADAASDATTDAATDAASDAAIDAAGAGGAR